MKKNLLKYLLIVISFVGSTSLVSCSDDNKDETEYTIQINDLPIAAQDFLSLYFKGETAEKIEKEIDGNVTVFVVELSNGFEIVFNTEGEWQEVEAPYGMTVPTAIIPEQVAETLKQQYQGYGINEINTTGEGWKVELSDNQGGYGIDIWFNMSGEIIQTSQDNV